jgi:AcrR family transcriptional regulator
MKAQTMSENALRDQQAELTRDLILDALARLVSDEGVHDFSIQRVADVAGVSHRTVYRHFSSREELLEALAGWLDSRMPREFDSYGADEIEGAIRDIHAVFEQQAERVKALAVLAAGARIRLRRRAQHTRTVERALAPLTAHLAAEDARAVAVLIRSIAGSAMWSNLTDAQGMEPQQVTRAVVWAVTTLVEAVRAGKGPGRNEGRPKKKQIKEKK